MNHSKVLESSLESTQNELKYFEEQNEQYKQNIQQIGQSIDEQRSFISDFEIKLQVFYFN